MLVSEDHLLKSKNFKLKPNSGNGWKSLDELGHFSSNYTGQLLTESHRRIRNAPGGMFGKSFLIDMGIPGYLLHDDALMIYKLAFTSLGDILELGTHKGLSTSIIAQALCDRRSGLLETVDIDAATTTEARANLASLPGLG